MDENYSMAEKEGFPTGIRLQEEKKGVFWTKKSDGKWSTEGGKWDSVDGKGHWGSGMVAFPRNINEENVKLYVENAARKEPLWNKVGPWTPVPNKEDKPDTDISEVELVINDPEVKAIAGILLYLKAFDQITQDRIMEYVMHRKEHNDGI